MFRTRRQNRQSAPYPQTVCHKLLGLGDASESGVDCFQNPNMASRTKTGALTPAKHTWEERQRGPYSGCHHQYHWAKNRRMQEDEHDSRLCGHFRLIP